MDDVRTGGKQLVIGIGISRTSYGEVLRLCRWWIDWRRAATYGGGAGTGPPPSRAVAVCSVHGVMSAFWDPKLRSILNQADVATPDGMPLVWALRSFGATGQRRVYGPNLMLALCGQAARLGHRVFLYGGRQATLPVLIERLRRRFPGLQIAGSYAPPFRPLTAAEDAAVVDQILRSGAELLFLGLGLPKQERWMHAHRDRLPGVVMIGVGAAFDFHAGFVRQAPLWMQRWGLEWLFRLLMEPRRLWRRYLVVNPPFLALWALQWVGLYRPALPAAGGHAVQKRGLNVCQG